MAHLYRLIGAFILAFVCLGGASPAAAAITPTGGYQCSVMFGSGVRSAYYDSCAEAAQTGLGSYHSSAFVVCPSVYPDVTTCKIDTKNDWDSTRVLQVLEVTYKLKPTSCPAFSTGVGASCNCNAGYKESGNICVPEGSGTGGEVNERQAEKFCAGMGNGGGWKQVGVSSGSTPSESCYMPTPPFDGADANKGCVTKLGDSVAVPNADGTRSWSAYGAATGAVCSEPPKISDGTSNQNPPPRAAENPCPKGYPGTVNGSAVCVPVSSTNGVDSTVKTASTNADGSKSEVIEDTKCSGGICTTTTTTNNYNSAGVSTGTTRTSATESIASKCTKSPTNKVCTETGTGSAAGSGSGSGSGSGGGGGGESSFGGTCANGFKAVSDDAVINAMAEETFRQNCKVNPDTESQKEGKAAYDKGAEPGNMTKDNPNNSEVSVGPERFDTSNAIGGGGCIADKAVTIAGKSITLPLSNVCQYLSVLGSVLMACSFLLAARIVTRG